MGSNFDNELDYVRILVFPGAPAAGQSDCIVRLQCCGIVSFKEAIFSSNIAQTEAPEIPNTSNDKHKNKATYPEFPES